MVYKKNQLVRLLLSGAGEVTEERKVVSKVTKAGVFLDNGSWSSPSGPFDHNTGKYLGASVPGFSMRIEALVPGGEQK